MEARRSEVGDERYCWHMFAGDLLQSKAGDLGPVCLRLYDMLTFERSCMCLEFVQ